MLKSTGTDVRDNKYLHFLRWWANSKWWLDNNYFRTFYFIFKLAFLKGKFFNCHLEMKKGKICVHVFDRPHMARVKVKGKKGRGRITSRSSLSDKCVYSVCCSHVLCRHTESTRKVTKERNLMWLDCPVFILIDCRTTQLTWALAPEVVLLHLHTENGVGLLDTGHSIDSSFQLLYSFPHCKPLSVHTGGEKASLKRGKTIEKMTGREGEVVTKCTFHLTHWMWWHCVSHRRWLVHTFFCCWNCLNLVKILVGV